MLVTKENIIGEIVANDYRIATVFKKYNIDFCCQGNRTIEDACKNDNVDRQQLIVDINKIAQAKQSGSIDFRTWPLDLVVDYIVKKHHRYVREKIIEINLYLRKISRVHGENHPELFEIEKLFKESSLELSSHMQREEKILFPYIRKLANAIRLNITLNPMYGKVQNPIKMIMLEHEAEGERFRSISDLTGNYTPPNDACNTYKVAFAMLREFEEDLHLHIHIENNILFPASIEVEQKINEMN